MTSICLLLLAPLLLQDDGSFDLERLRKGELVEREKSGDRIGAFEVSAKRERALNVTSRRHEYEIRVGGTADMQNTLTRSHGSFRIAFQPNLSLAISNTGTRPVVNPRVVVNGRRRWWSMESLMDEILAGAKDDQEKALRIWDFVRKNRHHDVPLFSGNELHDPIKMLNAYGGGLCDDSGAVGCSLLFNAGLNRGRSSGRPKVRHLHGHVMVEAFLDGAHQFLDIDQDVFYLDRENERIVSGDELARDHDLAKREHTYGPLFRGWGTGVRAASLFGRDDGQSFRPISGHRIEMTLRPGETIVYRWDNNGKYATSGPRRRAFWGTSQVIYAPWLEASGPREFEMKSPYPLCGGTVRAEFRGEDPKDRFAVSVSTDGKSWREVWSRTAKGRVRCRVELDEALEVRKKPAKYRYVVRISSGAERLTGLVLVSDIMASPHSLPALDRGRNRIVYSDETEGPREVSITHRWRESGNVVAPEPPARPVFPEADAEVKRSTFAFRWPEVEGADAYHLLVSRTKDMKLPYRPSFDIIVQEPTLASPYTGMFSPDTDYFWSVRPRGKEGMWGEWSPVWRFRWAGPRVPLDLETRFGEDGKVTLSWKPNPRGPRPVSYRVYGSDERGFSVSDEPYTLERLGRQQANFLGKTEKAERVIVSPEGDRANLNRCYYRVVAVDPNDTRSGPSDYVELPHPYIYSRPPTEAAIGKPFRYAMKTIRSLGDLQCRYTSPRRSYWEKESYSFKLLRGPKWLSLDAKKGVLSGTPGPGDEGTAEVEVLVTRQYPDEVGRTKRNGGAFAKKEKRFQATHTHPFRLRVR